MPAQRPSASTSPRSRDLRGRIRKLAGFAALIVAAASCEMDGRAYFPDELIESEGSHRGALVGLASVDRFSSGAMYFQTDVGCYTGDFRFRLPAHVDLDEVERLRIQATFRGPDAQRKLWHWNAFSSNSNRFRRVGDNSSAIASEWMLYDFELPGAPEQYVNGNREVFIRYMCNGSHGEEMDSEIDFMALVIEDHDGEEVTPPSEEPPAEEPPAEEPPAEEPPPVPDAAVAAKIAEFRQHFDGTLASRLGGWESMAASGGTNSVNYYLLSLVLDGVLSMYEATGDTRYVDTSLDLIETMIDQAIVTSSGSWAPALGWRRSNGQNSLLDEFQAVQPMARVARIVHEDPQLAATVSGGSTRTYGERAVAIRDWADVNIMQKWLLNRAFGNYSNAWDWMTNVQNESPGVLSGYIQGHQIHCMRAARNLYEAGVTAPRRGGETWGDLSNEIADIWESRIEVQANGAYFWDRDRYLWTASTTGIVDTFHSNKYIGAAIDLYEAGAKIDHADLRGLSRTFTQHIWNGRYDAPDPDALAPGAGSIWFRNYIDGQDVSYDDQRYTAGGSGHAHYNRHEGMSGTVYDGWCRLGQADRTSQEACEALLDFMRTAPDTANAIRNRNGANGIGDIALTGHLARNLRFKTW